jgi:hypothetical protein
MNRPLQVVVCWDRDLQEQLATIDDKLEAASAAVCQHLMYMAAEGTCSFFLALVGRMELVALVTEEAVHEVPLQLDLVK